MIWGILLSAFGLGGTFGFWNYIVNDIRYSYRSPFTSHELTILCLLFLSIAMLACRYSGNHFRCHPKE